MHQRGSALVWALFFVVVTTAMVISHATNMASHRRELEARYEQTVLAENFARSGLTDTLTWFRQRSSQPVRQFAPRLDETATPPVLETMDPLLGLVREFEIHGSLWGRYEVRRSEVYDVSLQRGQTTPGTAWRVGSRGFIYRLVDPTKSFDQLPNRIIAVSNLEQEIRRLEARLPAEAAISVGDPSTTTIKPGAAVYGGGRPAIAFPDNVVGIIDIQAGATLDSAPVSVPNYDDSPTSVLGMATDDIRRVSDLIVRSADHLPAQTAGEILYVPGNLDLTANTPVTGNMLLIVDGDLTVQPGASAHISGLMYVSGSVQIDGNLHLQGSMIARGGVVLGSGAEVRYDTTAVETTRAAGSLYRFFGSSRQLDTTTDTPTEPDLATPSGMLTQLKLSLTALDGAVTGNADADPLIAAAITSADDFTALMVSDTEIANKTAFDALDALATTTKDLAILVGTAKLDPAQLDRVRSAALAAVATARMLAELAVLKARAEGKPTIDAAELDVGVGDVKVTEPEASVTGLGISWTKYDAAIQEYQAAWEKATL